VKTKKNRGSLGGYLKVKTFERWVRFRKKKRSEIKRGTRGGGVGGLIRRENGWSRNEESNAKN